MVKLKVNKKAEHKSDGLLYVLYLWIDDIVVYKVGVTSRLVQDRVVEILTSYWIKYRIFPKLYPKRYRHTEAVYTKEAMMHKYFDKYRHKFDKEFSGCTEFFVGVDEDELLAVYDDVMKGIDVNDSSYCYKKADSE